MMFRRTCFRHALAKLTLLLSTHTNSLHADGFHYITVRMQSGQDVPRALVMTADIDG